MTAPAEPLGRDEVLGGLVARRAAAAVFAIEARAAQLALSDMRTAAPPICEDMVVTAERDWLAAVTTGGDLPDPPRIQHLERSAEGWAHLVPDDPTTRAAVAHRLLTRHRARRDDVPGIRAALGLHDPAVRTAHRRRHGQPVDALFTTRLPHGERLRWTTSRIGAWFDALPPTWAAFALTLTQTVGAGILALPIALATIGPLPGLGLVVLLGLVNVVTAAAMAEAFARTGSVRWGGAFLGRIVRTHLGRGSEIVLSLTFAALTVVVLLAYYVGLGTTMQEASGIPAPAWIAVLFAVTMYFTVRGRLGATIASALAVGTLNLLIVGVLVALGLGHLDPANLAHSRVPLVGGRPLDPAVLELMFGVVLLAFFGHTAVANGARNILQRDPSGRSLVRGTMSAMGAAIVVYAAWIVAVGGAVDPERLAGETGTALAPLAEVAGPVVLVVGTVFVVASMGMAAVTFSLGLYHQVRESLPGQGRTARLVGLAPLVGIFLLVETLVVTDRASFTASLGLVGTVVGPLLAGVFPVLLVFVARRRGGYVPDGVPAAVRGNGVLVVVFGVFLSALVVHGLAIWDGPVRRAMALGVALLAVGMAARMKRAGRLVPLTVLELRRDQVLGLDRVRLVTAGRRTSAHVEATTRDGSARRLEMDGAVRLPERTTHVRLWPLRPATPDLQVWAHEVTSTGASAPLDVTVALCSGEQQRPVPITAGIGTATLATEPTEVTMDLAPRGDGRGVDP